MSQRRPISFTGMVQPLGGLWHRFAFVLLLFIAFTVMLVGKADILIVNRLKVEIADTAAPILEVLSKPTQSINHAILATREWRDLKAMNLRLQEENARLQRWRGVALELEAENLALRALTQFQPAPRANFISSRVIADGGGPFVHSVMINAGKKAGVRRGLAAVSSSGLVGTVVNFGDRHSRVLLITDLNSQIPAVVERSRAPAVVAGDNSPQLKLLFLPQNANVQTGDRIVTSGHGGVLPAGIAIGTVTAITKSGIRITPAVDWDSLEYVRILDYQLDGVVAAAPGERPIFSIPRGSGETQPFWLPKALSERQQ